VCLTAWMEAQLRLAIWVPDDPVDLGAVERELLRHWQPPLNLAGVSTPWTARLQAARRVMAEEARRSAATNPGDQLVHGGLPLNREER